MTTEQILKEINRLKKRIESDEEQITKLIKELPALYYVLSYSWASDNYVFGSGYKFPSQKMEEVVAKVIEMDSDYYIHARGEEFGDVTEVAEIFINKQRTSLSNLKIGRIMRITPLDGDYQKILNQINGVPEAPRIVKEVTPEEIDEFLKSLTKLMSLED